MFKSVQTKYVAFYFSDECSYSEFGPGSATCGPGTQIREVLSGNPATCTDTVQDCNEGSCPGEC